MKKRILALSLSAALLLALLCACGDPGAENTTDPANNPGGSPTQTVQPTLEPTPEPVTVDLAAFYEKLAEAYEFPVMMPLIDPDDPDFLEGFYPGLSGIATEQLVAYTAMINTAAFEIVLVQVTNSGDVKAVTDILQARIDAQANGGAFYPATTAVWEKGSRIVTNGNYVMLVANKYFDLMADNFNAFIADPSYVPAPVDPASVPDIEPDDDNGGGIGLGPGIPIG